VADIRKKGDRAYLVRWREEGRQRYRQFRSEAEALDWKLEIEGRQRAARVLSGVPGIPGWDGEPIAAEDPSTSVAGYAFAMLDADRDLRPTTRALYDRTIRHHLDGTTLGAMDLRHVTPADISAWWDGLRNVKTGEPAGTGVRRNAQQLLARVFNRAVLVGDLEVSPLKRTPEVRRPRSAKAGRALTLDQLERLADAAGAGDRPEQVRARDRLVVLIRGCGGLRAGEVGGLRVDDVQRNGNRCRLRILRAVVRETGAEAYVAELKTAAGRRSVSIPCSIADELSAYVDRFGVEGVLFTKPNGALLARNDISYLVRAAARRAGIPDVHAHGLRHTAASLAVQAGANPEALRAMLGHSDVRLTLSTYTHLFDWGADEIADAMERLREERRG
jgi:integrase